MDEIRVFGECECCGNAVTDDGDGYYVSEDGRVFCSVDCVLEHYGIVKVEV